MTKQIRTKKKNYVNLRLRLGVALAIIVAWLAVAGIGGPYFGRIDEVSSNDLASFLPANAESTKVKDELGKFQDSSTIPAIVVFESGKQLTAEQKVSVEKVRQELEATKLVQGDISQPVVSDDSKAAFLVVPLDDDADLGPVITKLKEAVDSVDTSLRHEFTGPAMFSRDLNKAFDGIDGTLLLVALAVVFIILWSFIVRQSCRS